MATVEQQKTVRANAKYVRSSARKARLITDLIRGRSVPEARTILAFSARAVAKDVDKVLRSAVANAESQHQIPDDRLYVSAAYVDEGPVMKRWRARARGRVARIKKRTCHITVKVAEIPVQEAPAPKKQTKTKPKAEAAETPKRKAPANKKPEEAKA